MILKQLQRERPFFPAGTRDTEEEKKHKDMPRQHLDLATCHARAQRKRKHETRLPGWGSQAN